MSSKSSAKGFCIRPDRQGEHLTEAENERLCLDEAERRQRDVWEGRVKLVPGDEAKALLDRALS